MAGVKGMKGGGGARPGSGPKPKKPRKSKAKAYQTDDPDDFLRALMKDPRADFKDRMAAALALKKSVKGVGPVGKREQTAADAQAVIRRSLAPTAPPSRPRGHLRAVK
jgi:hypothetical protein